MPSRCKVRDKDLPDAHIAAPPHQVAFAIPIVEVTDNGDALRIGRPDGKMNTGRTFMLDQMRAHLVMQAIMRAFRHQHVVDRPKDRPECVRVGHHPFRAARLRAVLQRLRLAFNGPFEQAALVDTRERA